MGFSICTGSNIRLRPYRCHKKASTRFRHLALLGPGKAMGIGPLQAYFYLTTSGRPEDSGAQLVTNQFTRWWAQNAGLNSSTATRGRLIRMWSSGGVHRSYRTEMHTVSVFEALEPARDISADWLQRDNGDSVTASASMRYLFCSSNSRWTYWGRSR
jgi:hypothetical protein